MEDLTKRAIRAYFRRYGESAANPANYSGEETIDGNPYVRLENARGTLALYAIKGDRLMFVDPEAWPDSLRNAA